jgi:uncharacterized protein (DUF983 family)
VLRQRCPRCFRGPIFRRLLLIHRQCPVCGLKFEREPGYFTGAMYVSYGIGILTTAAVYITLLVLGQSLWLIGAILLAQVVVQMPVVFQYSRVIWLHVDYGFDPSPPLPR